MSLSSSIRPAAVRLRIALPLATLVVLPLVPGGARAQLTPEQAIDRRAISDPRYSPDGKRVAFTVTEPAQGATANSHIWMLEVKSREVRLFAASAKSDRHPRWSPDGKSLAFLSSRADFTQIYLIPADGGEALALTKGKNSVEDFEWSTDGMQIAFLAPEPQTEEEERKEKDKDDARVVDKSDKLRRLWVVEVETGAVRQLTRGRWEVSEFKWAREAKGLFAIATDRPDSDQWHDRIVTISQEDGAIRELLAPRGPISDLRVSPDGKTLGYAASRTDGPVPHDLYLLSTEGGAPRNATAETIDRAILGYGWRADGSLVALAATGFTATFYLLRADGRAEALPTLPVNPSDFSAGPGGEIAFVGQTTTEAPELWLSAGPGPAAKVSDLNAPWKDIAVVRPEFFRYKSFDGLEIEAELLKPAGLRAGERAPLIVLVHGGPTGGWADRFERWGQLLAARGYAVLYPNVRGSIGYGQRFLELNRADWGGGDFRDILAGVDNLIDRGIADPQRLGIGGWSYGGYMSAWAITQTHRFKASIVGAGMSDLAAEYGTEQHPAYDEWFYGLPYENLEKFLAGSPIRFVKNVRTPTLILHGSSDPVDPLGQAQQFYRALKRYGVPVEFVVYPREEHPVREQQHTLDLLRRVIAWYERYLKTPGASAGEKPAGEEKTTP